jgi:hypothetical protein
MRALLFLSGANRIRHSRIHFKASSLVHGARIAQPLIATAKVEKQIGHAEGPRRARWLAGGSCALLPNAMGSRAERMVYIGSQPKARTGTPVNGIKPPIRFSSICGDENQLP